MGYRIDFEESSSPPDWRWLANQYHTDLRIARNELERLKAPIPMILYCPMCGCQHIDESKGDWANPPHKSHLCHYCGTIWRPADVYTTGVASIQTKGENDTFDPKLTRILARSKDASHK